MFMPFESKSQQRFMFAKHPRIAKRWAKKTPDMKHLPEKAEQEKKSSLNDCFTKIALDKFKGLIQV
jgi:hypothetical protein